MERRIIDLSTVIEPNCKSEEISAKIKYIDHKKGALYLGLGLLWKGKNKLFNFIIQLLKGNLISKNDFEDNMGLSTEFIKLSSHTGTHVDSPYHYGPNNINICEVNLDYFFQDGVVLDFSERVKSGGITRNEIISQLTKIGYKLKEKDIVILKTDAEKYLNNESYKDRYFGLDISGLNYLLDEGIKVIGTDAFGLDQPFKWMLDEYKKKGKSNSLWPIHIAGRRRPYCMIEKIVNLDSLKKPYGFKIIAFPIKVAKASAGWTRIVAIENGDL